MGLCVSFLKKTHKKKLKKTCFFKIYITKRHINCKNVKTRKTRKTKSALFLILQETFEKWLKKVKKKSKKSKKVKKTHVERPQFQLKSL